MSGYAPNPSTAETAAASLTSGLLARKGQATPAVDAVIHEGVDVDLNTNFAAKPKRRVDRAENRSQHNGHHPHTAHDDELGAAPAEDSEAAWTQAAPSRPAITLEAAPEPWSLASEQRPRLLKRAHRERGSAAQGGLRATVKFRMPATDFVRLRAASRAMRESCQIIIVDAIAAYLDANEVEPVDEETARREAARLARGRRQG